MRLNYFQATVQQDIKAYSLIQTHAAKAAIMGTSSLCMWILAYLLPQDDSEQINLAVVGRSQAEHNNKCTVDPSEDSACTKVALKCAPLCVLAHFYLKKLWFSTQTFHSLLADRWFCSLNPTVLSNCSVCWRRNSFGAVLRGLVTVMSSRAYLSWSDFNVKVVPLVGNL